MLYHVTRGRSENLPLLFIHGGGLTGRMWFEIADRLPNIYAVLPDLPGHGESAFRKLTSLEKAADDLADLIEYHLDGRPVDIVGLSFGAYVGLTLMRRHPHLVERSCLSGFHAGDMPNPKMMKFMLFAFSPLMRFGWFHKRSGKSMGVKDTSLFVGRDGKPNLTPATLRTLLGLVIDFDARPFLPEIAIPTLVLAGEKEHPAILKSLEEFSDLMSSCQAGVVPGLGHAWCAEDPDLFSDTVRRWMSSERLPGQLQMI